VFALTCLDRGDLSDTSSGIRGAHAANQSGAAFGKSAHSVSWPRLSYEPFTQPVALFPGRWKDLIPSVLRADRRID
jgi:hypothetical protein